jgi:hypothetical protein
MGKLMNLLMQDCPEFDWMMAGSFKDLQEIKTMRSIQEKLNEERKERKKNK